MKKTILTAIFCVCAQFLIFGSTNDSNNLKDSLKKQIDKPSLRIVGTKIYKGNTLLTKSEVLNILSTTPAIAQQYEKGTGLRSTGTLLLVGGIVTFTGGIVLIVNGIETTSDYYGNSSVNYNSNYFLGLAIGSLGELMFGGGIACRIVGKAKIKRAINNYNATINTYGNIPGEINYQVGFLDNGKFGLKLIF